MFNVGDKVYYTSGVHGTDDSNPLKGSEYECEGTVIKISRHEGLPYHVQWNNTHSNVYRETDLTLITKQIKRNEIRLL